MSDQVNEQAQPIAELEALRQQAGKARAAYDHAAAAALYTQALANKQLAPEMEYAPRDVRAACCHQLSDYAAEAADLEAMALLAQTLEEPARGIAVLSRQAQVVRDLGNLAEGQRLAESAVALARQVVDPSTIGVAFF